jgi:hypothetical protein
MHKGYISKCPENRGIFRSKVQFTKYIIRWHQAVLSKPLNTPEATNVILAMFYDLFSVPSVQMQSL